MDAWKHSSPFAFLSLQETSCLPPVCTKGGSSLHLFSLVAVHQAFLRNQVQSFNRLKILLSDLSVGRCRKNYSGVPKSELQQVSSRLMTSSWQAGQISQSPWWQWERPDTITHPTHLSPRAPDKAQQLLGGMKFTPHCCPQLPRHPEKPTVPAHTVPAHTISCTRYSAKLTEDNPASSAA